MSDLEPITIPNDANNPYIAEYDGFITTGKQSGTTNHKLYVNGTLVVYQNNAYEETTTIPIKKGDSIYKAGQVNLNISFAHWYKYREL